MDLKDIYRTSILFCGSLLLNLLIAFLTLKMLRSINAVVLNLIYENSSLDNILLTIHTLALNGIFFLAFSYFIYLDTKTIFFDRRGIFPKSKPEIERFNRKKEYINKAYNLYAKIPIEYPLTETVKIYIRRLWLVFFVLLPFYVLTVAIYFFLTAPMVMSVAFLVVFLGSAFLYLYEFNTGKKLEKYIKYFIDKLKPDEIEE